MQIKQAIESVVLERKAGRGRAETSWAAIPLDIARLLGILVRIESRRQNRLRALREKGDR